MPHIRIEWLAGRSVHQKRELAAVLAQDVARIGSCRREDVEIVFVEVASADWAVGGVLLSEVAAAGDVAVETAVSRGASPRRQDRPTTDS